jgi:hypothetical protein
MGNREDQIAGANLARAQSELDRIRPIANTDRVPDADKICKGGFECLDLSPQEVEPAFENPRDRGVYGRALREIAGARGGLGDLIR